MLAWFITGSSRGSAHDPQPPLPPPLVDDACDGLLEKLHMARADVAARELAGRGCDR